MEPERGCRRLTDSNQGGRGRPCAGPFHLTATRPQNRRREPSATSSPLCGGDQSHHRCRLLCGVGWAVARRNRSPLRCKSSAVTLYPCMSDSGHDTSRPVVNLRRHTRWPGLPTHHTQRPNRRNRCKPQQRAPSCSQPAPWYRMRASKRPPSVLRSM
jgi:hypothetical protein